MTSSLSVSLSKWLQDTGTGNVLIWMNAEAENYQSQSVLPGLSVHNVTNMHINVTSVQDREI